MFSATMRYAAEMLTWQHHDVLPPGLKPQYVDNTYVTMLFNDEVHTYQQVCSKQSFFFQITVVNPLTGPKDIL